MPEISVVGKPTFFFSPHHADKSWRLKEKIVAVIESFLQGEDNILTFSTAKIVDVIGSVEDVDVAYASLSDPTKAFSFVEVRDRSKSVGRQYIQEIMGKRKSLGIDVCQIVSTKGFAPDAIRLASHEGISLRLLAPETAENTKRWFKPDEIRVAGVIYEVEKCSVLVSVDGRIIKEFKFEQDEVLKNKIWVPTGNPHEYDVVSLSRVFDADIIQKPERERELLVYPADGRFRKVTTIIEYKSPRLYLRLRNVPESIADSNPDSTFPIVGIVFSAMICRTPTAAKITERYKYLDAVSREKIAELLLARIEVERRPYYVCLVRCNCDNETCQLGGAFFR